ncbi:hypothetical protein [uncultured Tessaracoccus sp.]|uniref:hypothetical protein n=1 Tax=uncultured Tessaracoccus sp. TaxID=905023 RepID=UPI0025CE4110|nr:hypothetical protein [uncultured Tessaracoccus sp.]
MSVVATIYVDTSALAALLVDQPERETLLAWLDRTTASWGSTSSLRGGVRTDVALEGEAS